MPILMQASALARAAPPRAQVGHLLLRMKIAALLRLAAGVCDDSRTSEGARAYMAGLSTDSATRIKVGSTSPNASL
jgi:hypothetical protein